MNFQEKIQQLRKEKGLSQEDFAEILGISRQAVAKWETGLSYPDVEHLIFISDYFKISIDRLLRQNEEECNLYEPRKEKAVSKEMIAFLCRAKKKTYAGKGAETVSSRPNSHDLQYIEGRYTYLDTYLGGEKFSGEEAVWDQDQPVWAMNYSGRLIGEGFSGDFLKAALYQVPEEYPFRGPIRYQEGDYTYHCIITGDVEWYQGYEEIFYVDRKVYECYFHGGIVT